MMTEYISTSPKTKTGKHGHDAKKPANEAAATSQSGFTVVKQRAATPSHLTNDSGISDVQKKPQKNI